MVSRLTKAKIRKEEPSSYLKFNGKQYRIDSTHNTRTKAESHAKSIRTHFGMSARIKQYNSDDGKEYVVYSRNTTKSRAGRVAIKNKER